MCPSERKRRRLWEPKDRVAVTTSRADLDEKVESRFGRAAFILLVDRKTLDWEPVENPGREARGGAGIKVAQLLSKRGVTDVVSGEFGPNAEEALNAAGIRMHRCPPGTQAREAVRLVNEGRLESVGFEPDHRTRNRSRNRGGRAART